MEISGISLKSFSLFEPFGFIDILSERISGVYVIIEKSNTHSEIVKIGESESIYSRFANYLSPFRSEKEKNNPKRQTKKLFRCEMQKGVKNGFEYVYVFKIVDDKKDRKHLERQLIEDYIKTHRKAPKMNNERWIEKFLKNLQ
jgi:hypothetical protein